MIKYAGQDAVDASRQQAAEQKKVGQELEANNQKAEQGKQIEKDKTEAVKETKENIENTVIAQTDWEILAEKLQKDYHFTEEQTKQILANLQEMKNINTAALTPPQPKDWAVMATSGIRAANALVSVSRAMDSLIEQFKTGNINLTTFVSSLSTMTFGVTQFRNGLTSIARELNIIGTTAKISLGSALGIGVAIIGIV